MNFKLNHENGTLIAVVEIEGKEYKKDVTSYFEERSPLDEWLDQQVWLSELDPKC